MSTEHDVYRAERRKKAQALQELGLDPFGVVFHPTHSVAQARTMAPEPAADGSQPKGAEVSVAGRIGNLRTAGSKLAFASLFDRSRADLYLAQRAQGQSDLEGPDAKKLRGIQLFLSRSEVDEKTWEAIRNLNLSDWIGVTGNVGRTKTGEVSIFVKSLTVLGKSMLPPPQQAGASDGRLADEIRQRHREVDLMMSDASLATFVLRSRIVQELRLFFLSRGFLEVETPMLHTVLGGASAKPFRTHHNALDLPLFMRIAPELHLKRLIVGGLERVFEINRNFRNEGLSTRHNPEFTMIEWYQAYSDHNEQMDQTEELLRHLADRVIGTRQLPYKGKIIDLGKPFRRYTYKNAFKELGGLDVTDKDGVTAKARELGFDPADFPSYDRLLNEVWEAVVEPHLWEPTFITDQPTWLTPLCRSRPEDPSVTMRFELFMANIELCNAYSELNDPDLQRERFGAQLSEATQAKDEEAGIADGKVDDDYCQALDHGLPVTGGEGMGIDRLVMLLTGCETIRDVILFPTMRPGQK